MVIVKNFSVRLLILLLLVACVEEEHVPIGTQLLVNTNMSMFHDSVDPWRAGRPERMGASRTVFLSGNRSLYIENPDSLSLFSGSWTQSYSGPMPAPGSKLVLTAFLKGEGVRNSVESQPSLFLLLHTLKYIDGKNHGKSAQSGDLSIEGDFNWIPIQVTLEDFPAAADHINVTFIFPYYTFGKIYLDEITLMVE
ncbi:MAG TPA: hypothetical protein VK921_12435 [Anditalea sp.]|nr:hypothetical protein [Anditalea sp.]